MTAEQVNYIIAKAWLHNKVNGSVSKGDKDIRYFLSYDRTKTSWYVVLCEKGDKAPVYTYLRTTDLVALIRCLKGV